MIIRPAGPADYPALAALWYESWMSVGISNETDLSREGVAGRFRSETSEWTLFVAEDAAGRIAGMLALYPEQNRIDQIFVAPGRKGQGIGTQMLEHARRLMPDGISLTTHEANARARAFYEGHGFRLVSTEDDPAHRRVKAHYHWSPDPGAD